jgi:hypothetical protein
MVDWFKQSNWLRKRHILCLFLFLFTACVNKEPSVEEWNLARSAFRAAQESEAKRYAPKYFARARVMLKKGERAFQLREYEESNDYFRKSRYYAEKAENVARVKMFKEGDMAP